MSKADEQDFADYQRRLPGHFSTCFMDAHTGGDVTDRTYVIRYTVRLCNVCASYKRTRDDTKARHVMMQGESERLVWRMLQEGMPILCARLVAMGWRPQ